MLSKRLHTFVSFPYITRSEMHPGKEAGALHPEDGDEDVGDKDEEDDDGDSVVQAVQALLVALFSDVSLSCSRHTHMHTSTHNNNNKTTNYVKAFSPHAAQSLCKVLSHK